MKPVLHSFGYCLDFLREIVEDIPNANMVAQPNGIMNHPAWVIGHLAYASGLLGSTLGLSQWLPDDWSKRYATGTVPVADVSMYEPKNKALQILSDSQSRITQVVDQLNDSQLDRPFPDESYHYVFPTMRHALTQILVGHTSYHIGQLPIWRRAMGLPRLRRSFE
jgi:hypothetical protein